MASITRLNKDMRERIARDIVSHRFGERIDTMAAEMARLAYEVRDFAIGSNMGLYAALPADWLQTDSDIAVNLGGESHRLYFAGFGNFGDHVYPLRKNRDLPQVVHVGLPMPLHSRINIDVRSLLGKRLQEFFFKRQTLDTDVAQANKLALVALNQFYTVDQAIKEWPEAEKFLTPYLKAAKVRLPVKVPETINATLGLPPEDEGQDNGDVHE